MNARPILFSGAMVRALLDGRKTQTRRIVKPQPFRGNNNDPKHVNECFQRGMYSFKCPYGQPGDLLWVRETLRIDDESGVYYGALNARSLGNASGRVFVDAPEGYDYSRNTVPAIHMPRWASRLTLELTDVRLQRLMDISADDAIAEGVKKVRDACYVVPGFDYDLAGLCHSHPETPFLKLWDSLNETRGFGSETNPWVWALTFKVHRCNVDELLRRAAA